MAPDPARDLGRNLARFVYWVATALIVGVGPALVSWAGRGAWVPGWLFGWGLFAALMGVLSFFPYFLPAVPFGLTLAIVPLTRAPMNPA